MAAPTEQGSTDSMPRRVFAPAAIFCLAFALRFAFLLQMRDTPMRDYAELDWREWFIYDSAYYHSIAVSISLGDLIASSAHFLSPMYGFSMGLVYSVFGVDLDPVRLVQCVLGSLSCVLLYWIGRQVFSEITGVLAGVCLALYGLHIYYTELILPTTLVVFLNLAFLAVVSIEPSRLTPLRSGSAGAVLGLAALAKENALLLVLATVALFLWQQRQFGSRRIAFTIVPFALGLFVTIAPVTIHNYVASGEFVLITTTAGRNLLKGNGPTANGTHVKLSPPILDTNIKVYLDGDVVPGQAARESSQMVAKTLEHMADQPIASAKLLAKKALLALNQRELFIQDNFYFTKRYSSVLSLPLPGFGLIGVLGLAGAVWSLRRWQSRAHLYAMLLVQIVSYTLVFVLARYRLVAVCCLILFASHFLGDALRLLKEGRWRPLALAAGVTLGCALLVNIRFAQFPYERGFPKMSSRIDQLQSARRNSKLNLHRRRAAPAATNSQPGGGVD